MLLKSCFDRFASFFGLIFFCPVLFVVAILIKVKMPEGPVIWFIGIRGGRCSNNAVGGCVEKI